MKKHSLSKSLFACAAVTALLCIATPANGGSPPIRITVFDANETVAFRGSLGAHATFATQNLRPGKYVVQFSSSSGAVNGNRYFLAISAGSKKVIASAVAGDLLTGRGAAMRVDVGPGLNITGQVVKEDGSLVSSTSKYRMIDGRPYIWIANSLGSNIQGRWVDATVAPATRVTTYRTEDIRRFQDHIGEGSMLGGSHYEVTVHGY
jgi:hypothetical protein